MPPSPSTVEDTGTGVESFFLIKDAPILAYVKTGKVGSGGQRVVNRMSRQSGVREIHQGYRLVRR